MATKFLEPGGDADFAVTTTNGFWDVIINAPSIVTDFVHTPHIKSIRYRPAVNDVVKTAVGTLADTGSRISLYFYMAVLPSSSGVGGKIFELRTSGNAGVVAVRVSSTGVLRMSTNISQIGTDGPTLTTGVWYRLSLAYTITSTTVNRFELFLNGASAISITNATIATTGSSVLNLGNVSNSDAALDFRSSDHYIDDSNSLTDPGNIWVTAKRPNANGTTNGFTTQIGSGGSGYGSGHSPQVNERALSIVNGWSMVGAGAAVTEEYSVENRLQGDMNINNKTIVDWLGWISADAVVGETASIIAGGVSSSYTTPANPATRLVTKIVGSTTYPAGGTDVGIISDTSLTTLNLYECGVLIAFIGPPNTLKTNPTLLTMGVG